MLNSYLCLRCSLENVTLTSYRNRISADSYTDANHIARHGKHFTGCVTSALNGVLLNNDPNHYASLMSATAQSGFIEIEHKSPDTWDNFNLYQQFSEPQADMRVYGGSIGASPLFKLVDIKYMGEEHGFGVTGCRKESGECRNCGTLLFDHSNGPALIICPT